MDRLTLVWLYFWNFRYLPLDNRLALIRLRRRWIPTETGLRLRGTLHRARALQHPPQRWPFLFLLRLLCPFPRWNFDAELPASPKEIVASPDSITSRWRDLMHLRSMPLWRLRDTPQRSFYRLYEALCTGEGQMVSSETEYFWHHPSTEWAVANIVDPRCADEEQYAVMASLAEALASACNWRNEIGLRRNGAILGPRADPPDHWEEPPSWTAKVPALARQLILGPEGDAQKEGPFHDRGITLSTGSLYTI